MKDFRGTCKGYYLSLAGGSTIYQQYHYDDEDNNHLVTGYCMSVMVMGDHNLAIT